MVEHCFGWQGACSRACFHSTAQAVAIAVLLALAACATVGGLTKDSSPEAKQAAVTARVQGFWDAMIDRNTQKAYAFLSPASREIVTQETFGRNARTGYTGAKVERVECDGAVCKVRLMVSYDHPLMKGLASPVEEKWVIDEGQVWLVW